MLFKPGSYFLYPANCMLSLTFPIEMHAFTVAIPVFTSQLIRVWAFEGEGVVPQCFLGITNIFRSLVCRRMITNLSNKPGEIPTHFLTAITNELLQIFLIELAFQGAFWVCLVSIRFPLMPKHCSETLIAKWLQLRY